MEKVVITGSTVVREVVVILVDKTTTSFMAKKGLQIQFFSSIPLKGCVVIICKMVEIYRKSHEGKVLRASIKHLVPAFIVYYYSVSKNAYLTIPCNTKKEAIVLLVREGFKRQLTRKEYNDFLKNESLKRIRKWLMERKDLLNFMGFAGKTGIGEEKFNAWLDDTKKELTVLEYNKLRACIKVIRGSLQKDL